MSFVALHELLSRQRDGAQPVCHDGARFVPWTEFAQSVVALERAFSARPQLRWLLVSAEPLDFAVRLFALLHAGKQVVIPPNTQPGTLVQLAACFDAVADLPAQSSLTDAPLSLLAPLDPNSAILDLYTSGSTGEPKRIRKTLAQFGNEVASQEELWGATLGKAVVVATVPHSHIYGLLFRLFWPLAAGRPFDNITCAEPDTLAHRLALFGCTALVSSPAQLSRLPELTDLRALGARPTLTFSSGGPLSAVAAGAFYAQLGQAPTEVFGSTETGGIAWRRQEHDAAWTPLPGIGIARADDGALLLDSPFLLASECPLRMDDAIECLPDGRFLLKGRLDRVVKIEEKRVSLPDLEARLCTHPWIAGAAAVPLTGRRQSIGAVVVLSPLGKALLTELGTRATTQSLRLHLADYFEPVLLPRRWRFVDQLPHNERGKLTQVALAALFELDDDESPAT